MGRRYVHFDSVIRAALSLAIGLGLAAPLWAASTIVTPSAGYTAGDIHSTVTVRSHDTSGNLMAIYDGSAGLKVFDRVSGHEYDLGTSGASGDSWNSFVTFSPSGNSIWVGYDYRIYEVTNILGTPTWNHRANLWYNFDLAFSGNTPYVSGLNSSSYTDPNTIWRLDTTGANSHAKVAEFGGFSAGLAFDTSGNLYYATNAGVDDKLVKLTGQQVGEGNKSLSDAQTLADLPNAAYDTDVDAAGHVIFDFSEGGYVGSSWTQLSSTLATWNGTVGSGQNYDVIATGGVGHWFTFLNTEGDALHGNGAIYLADGAYYPAFPGLAEIRPVPEPSAITLLLAGASAIVVWAWRRRN